MLKQERCIIDQLLSKLSRRKYYAVEALLSCQSTIVWG